MRFNLLSIPVLSTLIGAGFYACTTSSSSPSLTLPNAPVTIHVGDTLTTAPATEKTPDPTGKITTHSDFTNYTLVSDNPAVLGISGIKVVGVAAGTTTFSAHASDGTSLVSAKYSITVTP